MRQIFLDTETTGLSPESGDRVIEIGCVELVNRRLTGRNLHFYVNPERRNSVDAYKVHGLSDEFLADKPLFGHVVDELIEFVRDAEIVIDAPIEKCAAFLPLVLGRLERVDAGLERFDQAGERHDVEHADQGLHAVEFATHILAEHAALEIG